MKEEISTRNSMDRYDSTYDREIEATYVGLFCLFVLIISIIRTYEPFTSIDANISYTTKLLIALVALRLIVPFGIVPIAKRQNRNLLFWGLVSFLFPVIAMIIIGQLKKLYIPVLIDSNKSNIENSKILLDKALKFYEQDKLIESKRFCLKAFELDNTNPNILKLMRRFGL